MRWRLILALSMFGLVMAIATVFVIPSTIEPLFWFVIFVVCAYIIARRAPNRPFLHGLLVSIVNSIWITAVHVLLIDSYLPRHPQEASMMASTPLSGLPRVMMALTGSLIAVASGVLLGLFAMIATRLV